MMKWMKKAGCMAQCHLDKMANQDLSIRYNTGVFLFVTFNNKCLTLKRKCAAAFAIE